ncbi:MAG: cupin domain-containing protein [Lachnospiraceae bacterium]|nr:cupin domain-containing protein [Lachnospiraceae bacterium]
MTRVEQLSQVYKLEKHVEGGSFSEVYTAPFEKDGRALAGSIFFLLDKEELSHFHEIDCDEIWYFHEGCGLKITVLNDEGMQQYLLGCDTDKGERSMVLIPKGSSFAAENLQKDGYTFVSCVTTPKFEYSGFRMIGKEELKNRFPEFAEDIMYLVDTK